MKAISTDILPVERACPSRGYVVRTKARRGTTAYWSAIRDYIPADGEIIVYSDYKTLDEKNIPGVKIGTGSALLQDLPFIDDADAADIAAKYTKPAAGIPKTDLDSSVQASLDKADAALPADAAFKTINGESVKGSGNINTDAIEIQNSPRRAVADDIFDEYFGVSAINLLKRGICGFVGDEEENYQYIYYKVSGSFPLEDLGDGPTVVFDDGTTRTTIFTRDEEDTIYIDRLFEEPSKVELQQSLTPGSSAKAPSVNAVKNRIEPIEAKIPAEASSSNKLADKAYVDGKVAVVDEKVGDIEELIPDQATAQNKLADKAFVNSSVQTATANYRGSWSDLYYVPAAASGYPEDYAGSRTPTVNDYLVVQDVSYLSWVGGLTYYKNDVVGYDDYLFICIKDHDSVTTPPSEDAVNWVLWFDSSLAGSNFTGTWRFKYTGNWDTMGKAGWQPEYQVNETPLTAAQLAALNSGITSSKVSQYDGYAQSKQDAADRIVSTPSASDLASTSKYPSMKTAADYIAATAVCSTTIRNIVTLTQAEYDALADKDANTFYVII